MYLTACGHTNDIIRSSFPGIPKVLNKFIDCKQRVRTCKTQVWTVGRERSPTLSLAIQSGKPPRDLLLPECHQSPLCYINRAALFSPQEPEGSSNKIQLLPLVSVSSLSLISKSCNQARQIHGTCSANYLSPLFHVRPQPLSLMLPTKLENLSEGGHA